MASGLQEALIVEKTLELAQQTEKKIDEQLQQLSNLDANDLEAIRRRRIEEMKQHAVLQQQWRNQGHGVYSEIGDEKEWFSSSKENQRLVCHFYRGTTWRCQIIDRHLDILAKKHMETKFIKINAENCPYLAEKLSIVLLPTIIMTKDNFTHDRIEGFDELGGRDDFTTATLEKRLAKNGIIDFEEPTLASLQAKKTVKGTKSNPTGKAIYGSVKGGRRHDDSDNEDNEESDNEENML